MKKIMNEWKNWLSETAPTDKALGEPDRERSGPYDRAARQVEMGKGYRQAAKNNIKNYLTSSRSPDFLSNLKDKLSPDEIRKIIHDINTMIWIYGGNTEYETSISATVYQSGDKYGTMYDNQPDVVGDPVKKLTKVLKILGAKPSGEKPSPARILDVYIYYIHPNYHTVIEPKKPKKPSSRFSKALSMSPEKLAQMNKDLYKRNK